MLTGEGDGLGSGTWPLTRTGLEGRQAVASGSCFVEGRGDSCTGWRGPFSREVTAPWRVSAEPGVVLMLWPLHSGAPSAGQMQREDLEVRRGWAGWALGTRCEGKGDPSWEGEEGACHPAVPVGTLQTGSLGAPGTEGEPAEDAALPGTWALLATWALAWLGARGGTWRALKGSRGVRGALVLFLGDAPQHCGNLSFLREGEFALGLR